MDAPWTSTDYESRDRKGTAPGAERTCRRQRWSARSLLEQRGPSRRRRLEPQVRERGGGGRAPARGALDQSLGQQEGLVHVLERVGLLPHGDRQRREADWSAVELLAERAQDLAIQPVEPASVDFQHLQCALGR